MMRCEGRGLEGEADISDAVLLDLTGNEVAVGDLELLFLDVARELDDLHPIQQSGREWGRDNWRS